MKKSDVFLNKLAKEKFDIHAISKEWRNAIFAAIGLKALTNIVSIFAAYNLVYNYLLTVTGNQKLSIATSGIFLILIEVVTLFSLEKSFKFTLHKRFTTAIVSFIFAIACLSLSFYLSTEGLALRQSNEVDGTSTIVENFKIERDGIESDYKNQISKINSEINLIKNSTWRGRLSGKQMNTIKAYNNDILNLRKEMKTEINTVKGAKNESIANNSTVMSSEGNKYYWIAAILLIMQTVLNFVLMLFWSLIRNEKTPKAKIYEEINELRTTLTSNMFGMVQATAKSVMLEITNGMQLQLNEDNKIQDAIIISNDQQPKFTAENKTTGVEPSEASEQETETEKTPTRKIGFQMNSTLTDVNGRERTLTDEKDEIKQQSNQIDTTKKKNYGTAKCEHCNIEFVKHSHNQKFCFELHRLECYEQKKGKDLSNLKAKFLRENPNALADYAKELNINLDSLVSQYSKFM